MHRTMMPAAEWDRELIADLAAERTGLGEPEAVGVRGLAAAHETRRLGDIAQVLPVAIAPRGSDREDALVDALRLTSVSAFCGGNHLQRHRRIILRGYSRNGRWEPREPAFKSVLHELGIGCGQAVLGSKRLNVPKPWRISRRDVPKLGQQLLAQRGRLLASNKTRGSERKFFHDPQNTKLLSKPAFTSWKMIPDRLASDGKIRT